MNILGHSPISGHWLKYKNALCLKYNIFLWLFKNNLKLELKVSQILSTVKVSKKKYVLFIESPVELADLLNDLVKFVIFYN